MTHYEHVTVRCLLDIQVKILNRNLNRLKVWRNGRTGDTNHHLIDMDYRVLKPHNGMVSSI